MGNYSENLDKETAISLVRNKKHKAFKNLNNQFWLNENDKTLHYGKVSLEGTIPLSDKGDKFHEQYFAHSSYF